VAHTEFGVKYDGPALTGHTIEIRDLAPSLMALGEMFTTASRVLHPDRDPVRVSLKATPEGSVQVELLLQAHGLWNQSVDIFSGKNVNALVNLYTLIAGTGTGVIWFATFLAGKRVKSRKSCAPGQTKVVLDDQTYAEVPDDMLKLYGSVELRKETRRFVEPLTRDDIDEIRFISHEVSTVTLSRGDLPAFEVPQPTQTRSSYETERTVTIVSPFFKDGNKWLFSDGSSPFYAAILDRDFRARVRGNWERFGQGDMLRCRVRTIQTRTGNVLSSDHEILEVLEHIHPATQLSLDADGEAPAAPAA
jgi:hypothetical protein